MRIYITHCSAKKADSARETGEEVCPQRLYTAAPTQRFMRRCVSAGVPWAIFSDLYGVWFPAVKHKWYEKHPDTVTDRESEKLLADFEAKLGCYDEVCFYNNPGRFHRLYERLIKGTSLTVVRITHLSQIGPGR